MSHSSRPQAANLPDDSRQQDPNDVQLAHRGDLDDPDAQEVEKAHKALLNTPWHLWKLEDLLAYGPKKMNLKADLRHDSQGTVPRPKKSGQGGKGARAQNPTPPKTINLTFEVYDLVQALLESCPTLGVLDSSPEPPQDARTVPFRAMVELISESKSLPRMSAEVTLAVVGVNPGSSDTRRESKSKSEAAKELLGKRIFTQPFKDGLPETIRKLLQSSKRVCKATSFSKITQAELSELGFDMPPSKARVFIQEDQMRPNIIQKIIEGINANIDKIFCDDRDRDRNSDPRESSPRETSRGAALWHSFWNGVQGSLGAPFMLRVVFKSFGKSSEMRTRTITDILAVLLSVFFCATGGTCVVFPEIATSSLEPKSQRKSANAMLLDPQKAALVISDTHVFALTGRADYYLFALVDDSQSSDLDLGDLSHSTLDSALELFKGITGLRVVLVETKNHLVDITTMFPQVLGQASASMYILQCNAQPYILTNGRDWIFGLVSGEWDGTRRSNRFVQLTFEVSDQQGEGDDKGGVEGDSVRNELKKLLSQIIFWSTQTPSELSTWLDDYAHASPES